jgi:hypothetical protein
MIKLTFIYLILVVMSVSCSQPGTSDQTKTPDEQVFKSDTPRCRAIISRGILAIITF